MILSMTRNGEIARSYKYQDGIISYKEVYFRVKCSIGFHRGYTIFLANMCKILGICKFNRLVNLRAICQYVYARYLFPVKCIPQMTVEMYQVNGVSS